MPKIFHYEGRVSNGKGVSGDLEVNTVDEAVAYLTKRNITPTNIMLVKKPFKLKSLLKIDLGEKKATTYDVMNFCRQLAALNGAGIPLIHAINQLSQSSSSPALKETLADIAHDISAGLNLGNALKKHPKVFPLIVINVIQIGESTGHLNETLIQLSHYLESTIANRRRLLSAVRYPSFVIITTMAAMLIMNFFVIPKFMMMFASFKLELPLATRIIMASSKFMTDNWKILAGITICIIFGIYRLLKIQSVRYFWDKHKLSFPIFGDLQRRIILSQFTWTFSLILRAGVPIIKGLNLASQSSGNLYFSKKLLTISESIEHGENFSRSASMSGLFAQTTIQMIEVGEESGRLDELLSEVAKYYDAEVDYDLRRINELIEPILLTIIGSMVLVLALGIYLPMWDLVQAIKQ